MNHLIHCQHRLSAVVTVVVTIVCTCSSPPQAAADDDIKPLFAPDLAPQAAERKRAEGTPATPAKKQEMPAKKPAVSAPPQAAAPKPAPSSADMPDDMSNTGAPDPGMFGQTELGQARVAASMFPDDDTFDPATMGQPAELPDWFSQIDEQTTPDRDVAFHVLNRLAFGPRPGQVQQIMDYGWKKWAKQQLRPQTVDNGELMSRIRRECPSLFMSMTKIWYTYKPPYGNKMAPTQEEEAKREQLKENIREELLSSVIVRAVYSQRQFQEVIVEFWRNHFNIDRRKDDCKFLANHYETNVIRKHAFGKFEHMLIASASHPAMLVYLDNAVSQKPLSKDEQRQLVRYESKKRVPASIRALQRHRGLNENYARELMELHTLGVDRFYTQRDVEEVARALTGWSVGWHEDPRTKERTYGFRFRPDVHDMDRKVILGRRINAREDPREGVAVLKSLARHPGTATFISEKLCRYLINDNPPSSIVKRAAGKFMQTRGDLPSVYATIIFSPEFADPAHFRAKFKTPFEYAVSALRAMDADVEDTHAILEALKYMGQPVYQKEDPTGYYDLAESWLDPGILMQRWQFALALGANHLSKVRIPDSLYRALMNRPIADLTRDLVHSLLAGHVDEESVRIYAGVYSQQRLLGMVIGSPNFQLQ